MVYDVKKGKKEALKSFFEDDWATQTPPKGLVGRQLAWLKEKGEHGETRMLSIAYWVNEAYATSQEARKQAEDLKTKLQWRLVRKQRPSQGKVIWHGETTRGVKIQLQVAPLQITFCQSFWQQVSDVFAVDELSAIENVTMHKLALARQVGAETLGELLHSYVDLDMDVQWAAPKLIVPIDPTRDDRAVAFLDLGQIAARSTPVNFADMDKQFDLCSLYEDIIMTIENVHLSFFPSKSALNKQLKGTASPPR